MADVTVMQGREVSSADIGLIRSLLAEHAAWGRTRLSEELCRLWNWRNAQGRIKDMAARTLLLKLERGGQIHLPARRRPSSNALRNRRSAGVHACLPCTHKQAHADPVSAAAPAPETIQSTLCDLRPLAVSVVVPGSEDLPLFNALLARYHYLGHRNTVGENLRYLVRDCAGTPVACVLFGSASWKCLARDDFIGWDRAARERNLQRMTNNTRFLVLPWVSVPHLASHVLGLIVRRIRTDWQVKYGHPVSALETFVDRERFQGTCYRAANWQRLGATQGRTRNDSQHQMRATVKDVYLYPLVHNFRQELTA